ncbi:MaoC family dehydratase [Parachitinimonas caeni]|uniref:MaoC family dehydratase n=1 Tax=Parachitinimonas caeni TaxID=3031301 RepID=A0ABT7E0H0_9NEIS|nr:MaoC family dehydratase [Parachitinimonas caeni]MDK2125805.1 MaoC family dehydratase [Parachitinimonas caeni]
MTDSSPLYFEDLNPGRVFRAGPIHVDSAEVAAFAGRYDPQPFHLDPVAAEASVFGSLVASGWQTAALTMRMLADSELSRIANGLVGLQIDKLMWHRPVKPGDTLTAEFDVLSRKRSQSRPGFGVVQLAWRTFNQHGELAMSLENAIWVQARTETV